MDVIQKVRFSYKQNGKNYRTDAFESHSFVKLSLTHQFFPVWCMLRRVTLPCSTCAVRVH
jgi:hypothetical protein